MEKLAQTKDFCPNASCPDYGKLQADQIKANFKKVGKTPRGVQRYQCKTCGKTFTETKGTIFYRKHAQEDEILRTRRLSLGKTLTTTGFALTKVCESKFRRIPCENGCSAPLRWLLA